jgi:hypothetical protein
MIFQEMQLVFKVSSGNNFKSDEINALGVTVSPSLMSMLNCFVIICAQAIADFRKCCWVDLPEISQSQGVNTIDSLVSVFTWSKRV